MNIEITEALEIKITHTDGVRVFEQPNFNPETQKPFASSNEARAFADKMTKREELFVVKETKYKALSLVEFVALVRMAGGMSAADAIAVLKGTHADEEVQLLSMMLEMAGSEIHHDNQILQGGLATLHEKGLIAQEPAFVLGAWPTE